MVTVTGVGGVVVVVELVEREAGSDEEELNDVLRDDAESVAESTIKKSRNNGSAWILVYMMVNTCEDSGRTGDWKNCWRYCVRPAGSALNLTGVPPSML